jgi:CubicO group peptidase (beta-lactamase class C family)
MAANATIQGECDQRFERVKRVFAENFERRDELGATVAVTLDGRPVVDLWGGHLDHAKTKPWQRDNIVNVWSTTKGLTAICAHKLAGESKLDLDAPVTKYWPEFAQGGKAEVPVSYLLNHKAGLAAIRAPLRNEDLFSWEVVTRELARQEPWWTPGTKHGYHAITFGWLVGEVVRRVSGKSLGTYFRDEIAKPLGIDAYIGFDASLDPRVAEIFPAPPPPPGQPNPMADLVKNPESVSAKAIMNPPTTMLPATTNSRAWRGAEIPGANGHANARALSRLYGALARCGEVDGLRVMNSSELPRCYTEQSKGTDAVLGFTTRFSLGFMMSLPGSPLGPNARSFGHPGAGGSLGFADPDTKIGFGYAMNQMGSGMLLDPRAAALIDAVYASL